MTVTLGREGEELALTVADDGQGFDVAAVRNNGRGLGLVTMEERVTWSEATCRSTVCPAVERRSGSVVPSICIG